MTTTVGDLIDRLYRDYLYPGDKQPSQGFLDTGINSTVEELVLDVAPLSDVIAELGPGLILEIGQERMVTTSWAKSTRTFGVRRGHEGTEPVEHHAGDRVLVSPHWSRRTVFDAVADSIDNLYPSVYRKARQFMPITGEPWTVAPPDMVGTLYYAGGAEATGKPVHFISEHPFSPHGILQFPEGGLPNGYLVYKARFTPPTTETQELASLGVTDRTWHHIIIVGALRRTLSGRDLSRTTVEFITEALEVQEVPVMTAASLQRALASYYRGLLEDAQARQLADQPPTVERYGVVDVGW